MQVVLIFPKSPQGSVPVEMPSPGLAYIKSFLQSKGVAVKVVDLTFPEPGLDSIVEKADYVGIYVNESVHEAALELARRYSGKICVAGGPYSAVGWKDLLEDFQYVVVGEGETAFYELVIGKNPASIKGLAYKDSVVRYKKGGKEDLERLPFPDYEGLPLEKYRFLRKNRRFLPIITSRGCSYDCLFCSVKTSLGKWRGRGSESIVEEIEYQKRVYDVNEFAIMDDNLTYDLERFEKLLDLIISRGIDISWQCPNGISPVGLNRRLVRKMRQAGCWAVAFAPEIGSEKKRSSELGKPVKNSTFVRVTRLCNEAGIFTIGFFIIGFPWESRKDIRDTQRFIKKMDCDMPQIKNLVPFKASRLGNDGKEVSKSFNDMKFIMDTDHLTTDELSSLFKKMYLRIYTPSRTVRILWKLYKNSAYYGIRYYLTSIFSFLRKF